VKTWIEDLICLRRQPTPESATVMTSCSSFPRCELMVNSRVPSTSSSHRCVEHKVHENLLQLDPICHGVRKILGKLNTD